MENQNEKNVEEVVEAKELKTGTEGKKKMNSTVVAIVAAVVFLGLGVALYFFMHTMQVKDAIEKVTGNDIVIKGNVAYLDGEEKKDVEVVQYEKPAKGDLIAKINVKNYGTITVRFFPEHAPLAVENFVAHAKEGYYDGLSFHRIMNDFMIQGGDPEGTGAGGESIWTSEDGEAIPFTDEYSKYLIPMRGALCMANAGANTNGSQFFIVQSEEYRIEDVINLRNAGVDYDLVNYYKENGGACWLYQKHTVFGQIVEGYDVLDKIAAVEVDSSSKPNEDVIIESIDFDVY